MTFSDHFSPRKVIFWRKSQPSAALDGSGALLVPLVVVQWVGSGSPAVSPSFAVLCGPLDGHREALGVGDGQETSDFGPCLPIPALW